MNKYFSKIFISNIKELRISLIITEAMMDLLLQKYDLVYTGVESQTEKAISLDLAKRISNLFGKDIEYFLDKDSVLLNKEDTPKDLQDFLTNLLPNLSSPENSSKKKLSLAAYVIIYLKYFNSKKSFANSDILLHLPPPLNNLTSIDWTSGLLKGLVTNTKKYKKNPNIIDKRYHGEAYYILKGPIPTETINKALKKVDPFWLKKFDENAKIKFLSDKK
ncbi:hypothetical protein [Sphingobacterium kitahiroshimense]|uniref:hypothetical protein n=1 Tax=Sphingobacterium kitahiroshimense TaxID=470446 RepID=UPI00320A0574